MFKFVALATVLIVAEAIEPYGHQAGGLQDGYHEQDYYTEPHYSFIYEVKDPHTHDFKSHKEERKGDHTQGVYYLVEPDGSKRTVEYIVEGKSGFNAIVHREHSQHPISSPKFGYNGLGHIAAVEGFGENTAKAYSIGGAGFGSSNHGAASSFASLSTKGGSSSSNLGGFNAGYNNGYHSISYSSLGGAGERSGANFGAGGYKSQNIQSNYHGGNANLAGGGYYNRAASGYDGAAGAATSSVKFSTHGANIAATTHHIVPVKHHY